jgi:protease-4
VSFIRSAWRLLMVVKDALVLIFLLLFFGLLYAALSSVRPAPVPVTGALLITLDGSVVEQPSPEDPFALLGEAQSVHQYRLRDVVHAIERGARDSAIKAIVLDLTRFQGTGQVAAQRIGAAMDLARKAGKPVLTTALAYDDDGYALAAHASEAWLSPLGMVALAGPGGSQLYYKGLIDKLGVNAHIYRVGTYKSFVEPFIRTDQSPAAKEANQALASALWKDWLANVVRARPRADVAAYAADPMIVARRFGGDGAKAALSLGLVDKLGDDFAFGAHVAGIAGEDPGERPGGFASISMEDYLRHHPATGHKGKVGVLTVAGDIVDGEANPGTAAGDSIAKLISDALSDGDIKALVVRVDSPGGSVTGAETIRQALLQVRKAGLPVVISMGNVAASGGYWISTTGDRIFAEPSTITGSIGVFGIIPSFEKSLAKIGVTTDGVRTTPLSGEPDVAGGVSPQFDALAQASVENMYRRFVGLVAAARKLTPGDAERIAEGRVWDGGSAHQLRLIDRFGSLEDAVAEAARLAKLRGGDARPRYLDPPSSPFEVIMSTLAAKVTAARRPAALDWLTLQGKRREQAALGAVDDARSLVSGPAMRADCLECRGYGGPAARRARRDGALGWLGAWLMR